MGIESIGLSDILRDVRAASENMDAHHSETGQRITAVEKSVNELLLRQQRPGREGGGSVVDIERKNVADYCRLKHELATPKNDGTEDQHSKDGRIA